MKDPYKNNSYLRNDAEQLRERLFFEDFCKKVGEAPVEQQKDLLEEKKDEDLERR